MLEEKKGEFMPSSLICRVSERTDGGAEGVPRLRPPSCLFILKSKLRMRERERGGRREAREDFEIRGTVDVALLGDTQVTKAREKGEREATRSVVRSVVWKGEEGRDNLNFKFAARCSVASSSVRRSRLS